MNKLRSWLIRALGGTIKTCGHDDWRVLIEHYPTFAWDKWQCAICGICKDFPNNAPPVPIETAICCMGHVHIANGSTGSGHLRLIHGTNKSLTH